MILIETKFIDYKCLRMRSKAYRLVTTCLMRYVHESLHTTCPPALNTCTALPNVNSSTFFHTMDQ